MVAPVRSTPAKSENSDQHVLWLDLVWPVATHLGFLLACGKRSFARFHEFRCGMTGLMDSDKERELSRMNARTLPVCLVYGTVALAFASMVLLNHRSYQDAWILQDLFIPMVLYVMAYAITITILRDERATTLVCSSFLVISTAVPSLKYEIFYGTYDSLGHYRFLVDMLSSGHAPQTGYYGIEYSAFPGMHALAGSLALVMGLSTIDAVKLMMSVIFGIIPLVTYLATRNAFRGEIRRWVIIASGLPTSVLYIFAGIEFALPLYYLFVLSLFWRRISGERHPAFLLVSLISGYGLLFSHAGTIIYLLACFAVASVLLSIWNILGGQSRRNVGYGSTSIFVLLGVSFVAWLMFEANRLSETLVSALQRIVLGTVRIAPIPPRLFALPLLDGLKIALVLHIKDGVLSLMALVGLLVMLKQLPKKSSSSFTRFYLPLVSFLAAIALLLGIQLGLGFGELGYQRFVEYAVILSPFLVGLALWHVDERIKKRRLGRVLIVLLLFLCVLLSLVQVFPYQPMVPRANVLSSSLPENEYIYDLRMVNTVYKEKLISFAQIASPKSARIAADSLTGNQIYGFADHSFSDRWVGYFNWRMESSILCEDVTDWDIALINYAGRSGSLVERAECRTQEHLQVVRATLGNVVYDNGGTVIIARTTCCR